MQEYKVADKVHQLPMNFNNTTSVNPIPVDYGGYSPVGKGPNAGCVDFVYQANKEMGGALFSPKSDPDIPDWARYFGFNRRVEFLTPNEMGRDEFDVKWTFADTMQADTSNQINWSEKGQWQIDPGGKWSDSGFNVAQYIEPAGFNEFMFRCSSDQKTFFTIDGLWCNGVKFTALPTAAKNQPLKKSGWTPMKAHFQEQAEVMNAPAYCIKRYQNVQLIFSDAPIPYIWFE